MWDVMLRRWLDLLFWWMPRQERTTRRAEPAPRERAPEPAARPAEPSARPAPQPPPQRPAQAEGRAPRAAEPSAPPAAKPTAGPAAKPTTAPEKTVAPPVPDDLTVIKGIGPAVQNKLRALGITTFADLAAADPDAILRGLKGSQPLTKGKVHAWTEAARERARG